MNTIMHFCQDHLAEETRTQRYVFYRCSLCDRIIKVKIKDLKNEQSKV
jgi:hypothetical protein